METYVVGKISRDKAANGSIQGVIDRLSPVGYQFNQKADYLEFNKVGRVESVITEMVPVCEDHGLDVEDFHMFEFRESDGQERSRFEYGKIIRKE
ncbi:MAG TPA: hypothetical protein VNT57_04225 [Desulfobacteria bacterium]|nr:hypothetical protein [Desulfobacteria bacterium]